MRQRIFITAAEVSGDQHAAKLARSLCTLDPSLIIEGLGGEQMASAGVHVHHETVGAAAMGHHALRRIREVYRLLRWTRLHYAQSPPDLHICVDSPAMNFHFAKLARQFAIPVMYYIAPQVWAWREGRIKKLKRRVDQVACILPFEEEYFNRHGVPAKFVGHPIFDELSTDWQSSNRARFPQQDPVIGLLAGSRASEASANLPHQLDVAAKVLSQFPAARFLLPTTSATHPIVTGLLQCAPPGVRERATVAENQFDEMVPRCDLCLTVSGTATLHVAGHGVPMIVVYRGNPVLWHLIGRWIVNTRTYSLVNLLADVKNHIVPEFVPWYGSNVPVADRAIEMLRHPEQLEAQRSRLRELVRSLDKPGASLNAAKLALEMIVAKQELSVQVGT